MSVIEPVEIILDKPRKLLLNHQALRRAENEVNKQRFAKPIDYTNIDNLMVSAYNTVFRLSGMLPRDLLSCLLWASIVPDSPRDPKLTIDRVDELLDQSEMSDADISVVIWSAYIKVAGKNFKQVGDSETDDSEEKKTKDQPTGSPNGRSDELN